MTPPESFKYLKNLQHPNLYSKYKENLQEKGKIVVMKHTEHREFMMFNSFKDLYKAVCESDDKYFYEINHEFCKWSKMYYDIDIDNQSDESIMERVLSKLIEGIKQVSINFGLDINLKDLMIFRTFYPNKLSAHIIIDRLVFLKPISVLKKFYEESIKNLGSDKQYIDNIYNENRALRTLHSGKFGKNSFKIFCPQWKFYDQTINYDFGAMYGTKELQDEDIFGRSLMTACSSDHIRYISSGSHPELYKSHIQENQPCLDFDTSEIWDVFQDFSDELSDQFTVLNTSHNNVNLKRKHAGYCPFCDRTHSSENASLWVCGKEKSVFFRCWRNKKAKFLKSLHPELCEQNQNLETVSDQVLLSILDEKPEPIEDCDTQIINTQFYSSDTHKDFDLNNYQNIVLRAQLGSNKTGVSLDIIKKYNLKTICLTSRKKLAYAQHQRNIRDGITSHLYCEDKQYSPEEIDHLLTLQDCSSIDVVQMESLYKYIEGSQYDCLFFDEPCAGLKQMNSSTHRDKLMQNRKGFEYLVQNVKLLILSDANIDNKCIELLKYRGGKTLFFDNQFKLGDDPNKKLTCIEVPEYEHIIGEMTRKLSNNKNIIIACTSKNKAKELHQHFCLKFPDKKGKLYTADENDQSELKDVNTFWKQYNWVIYNTCIGAGISYDDHHFIDGKFDSSVLHFDFQFIIHHSQCNADIDAVIQMSGRVRYLKEKTMYFYIGQGQRHQIYGKYPVNLGHLKHRFEVFQRTSTEIENIILSGIARKIEYAFVKNGKGLAIWKQIDSFWNSIALYDALTYNRSKCYIDVLFKHYLINSGFTLIEHDEQLSSHGLEQLNEDLNIAKKHIKHQVDQTYDIALQDINANPSIIRGVDEKKQRGEQITPVENAIIDISHMKKLLKPNVEITNKHIKILRQKNVKKYIKNYLLEVHKTRPEIKYLQDVKNKATDTTSTKMHLVYEMKKIFELKSTAHKQVYMSKKDFYIRYQQKFFELLPNLKTNKLGGAISKNFDGINSDKYYTKFFSVVNKSFVWWSGGKFKVDKRKNNSSENIIAFFPHSCFETLLFDIREDSFEQIKEIEHLYYLYQKCEELSSNVK